MSQESTLASAITSFLLLLLFWHPWLKSRVRFYVGILLAIVVSSGLRRVPSFDDY